MIKLVEKVDFEKTKPSEWYLCVFISDTSRCPAMIWPMYLGPIVPDWMESEPLTCVS